MIFDVLAGENSKYPGVFDGGFTINRSGSIKEGDLPGLGQDLMQNVSGYSKLNTPLYGNLYNEAAGVKLKGPGQLLFKIDDKIRYTRPVGF